MNVSPGARFASDDGAVLERYEWAGLDAWDQAVDRKDAEGDWRYQMRRVMDSDGRVDPAVMAKIKATWGARGSG
jgi:hypothetical protein